MASDNEASCASDPNFAVICSFLECFGKPCGIVYPDIARLQEMLENTQEVPQQLIDLHIKLLRKTRKTVSPEKWERALVKFCHTYSNQDGWELERFGYKKARIAVKLRLLKVLLETQFDLNQKFKNEVNKLAANELRVEPLGRDKTGLAYWCQLDEECNIRVYREDLDEENWELVAKDREGVVTLISTLSNGEEGPIPINEEDSNSLEISEKPIIDTGQVTSSPSLEDEAVQENGINAEGSDDKELEKSGGSESEVVPEQDDSNETDNIEEEMEGEDEVTNDENESSKQNTEEDDSQETLQNQGAEINCVVASPVVSTFIKTVNGKVDSLLDQETAVPGEKEASAPQEAIVNSVVSGTKHDDMRKFKEHAANNTKTDPEEAVPLKSIETPVITSPLKLVNVAEMKQSREEKVTIGITPVATPLLITKKHEDSIEQILKPLDKLPSKNNLPFSSTDMPVSHNKLSIKPIDQLAANLVRIQSEKLEKPSGAKSLEKIAENLARSGSAVTNVVNGDDSRLPQDFCARSQTEKANALREHRGMDLSTSPRGWESANEQNRPMDFSGIDLSSRKFNKTVDLPSPGYRTQDFQHREMDLSTKKLNKPEITNSPYDARAVMMRNHAMVADLSKRQMPFTAYEMSSAPYHNSARISSKEDHRLPNYTILPDPSKIAALRMNPTPMKRPIEVDDLQQDMLKRLRADVIPIRGSMDKRPMMGTNWRDEVGEAIEEPMMMVQGEGSGSDCDAVNPDVGEAVEEPIIFFYGEGSGEECETGNPGDDTSADNKESNETKNEADSATASLSPNKNLTEDSLTNEVSTGSLVANKSSSIKLNRNFSQSSVNVKGNCQIVGSTQEKQKFKPTLGIQIIPKNSNSSVKRLSRWDVGKPEEKTECDSSIISNERDISPKRNESECGDSTSGSQDVKVDGNSVDTKSTTSRNDTVETEGGSLKSTGGNSSKQEENQTTRDSVQCDSSISLCQADTSEASESSADVTATTQSGNDKDTTQNICDSDSTVPHETGNSEKVDNECKPASSPPRFFFGPNCIPFDSRSEVFDSQSDHTVSTTIQSKSDTLQYECVSSSKPIEDISTSYKSDDFDVTQTNNNSLKVNSYASESNDSFSDSDNKNKPEKVEGPTNTWEQTISSKYSTGEHSTSSKTETNLFNCDTKMQDPISSSENTMNNYAKFEDTETIDTNPQPHSTNDLNKEDSKSGSAIIAPSAPQCNLSIESTQRETTEECSTLEEQLQNDESKSEDDIVKSTETSTPCSEGEADSKSCNESTCKANDVETNSVSVNNSCSPSFIESSGPDTKQESNPSEAEVSACQEVDSSAEKEAEHPAEKESDPLVESNRTQNEVADNSTESDDRCKQLVDANDGREDNVTDSDADSMSVINRTSEETETLREKDSKDHGEEAIDKTLDSLMENSVPGGNAELHFPDSSAVTSSESIDQSKKDTLVPTISSSDDACVRDSTFQDSVKTHVESEKSSFQGECPIYNALPEIVPDTNTFKPSKSDTVKTANEMNLSNLGEAENKFENVLDDQSSCVNQDSSKDTISDDRLLECNESNKLQETFLCNKDINSALLKLHSSSFGERKIDTFHGTLETGKIEETILGREEKSLNAVIEPTMSGNDTKTHQDENDNTNICKDVVEHVQESNRETQKRNLTSTIAKNTNELLDESKVIEKTNAKDEVKGFLVANYGSSDDSNDSSDNVLKSTRIESPESKTNVFNNLDDTVVNKKNSENENSEKLTTRSETLFNEIQNTLTDSRQAETVTEKDDKILAKAEDKFNTRKGEASVQETNCNIDCNLTEVNENRTVDNSKLNDITEITKAETFLTSEPITEPLHNQINKECINSTLVKTNNLIDVKSEEENKHSVQITEKSDYSAVNCIKEFGELGQAKEYIELNEVNNQITYAKLKGDLKPVEEKIIVNSDNSIKYTRNEAIGSVAEEYPMMDPLKKLKELSEFGSKGNKFDLDNISSGINKSEMGKKKISTAAEVFKPVENIQFVNCMSEKSGNFTVDEGIEHGKHNEILPFDNTALSKNRGTAIFTAQEESSESTVAKNDSKKEGNKRLSDTSDIQDVPPLKSKPSYVESAAETLENLSRSEVQLDKKTDSLKEVEVPIEIINVNEDKVYDTNLTENASDQSESKGNAESEEKRESMDIHSIDVKAASLASDDSMGMDNDNLFSGETEELDPLACTEDDVLRKLTQCEPVVSAPKIGLRVKPVSELVYEGWKLDNTESPKVSRKRRNSSHESNSEDGGTKQEDEEEMMGGKRIKLRGRRIPDKQLRKSVEESRIVTISSDDEAVKDGPEKLDDREIKDASDDQSNVNLASVERKARGRPRGRRRRGYKASGKSTRPKHSEFQGGQASEVSPEILDGSQSNNDSLSTTPTSQKKRKKRKMVLGLEIGRDIDPEIQSGIKQNETPVRQSRRIAQLKIKEEADRRRVEEASQVEINKEKKDSTEKKKRKKQKPESEEEVVIKDIEKEQKSTKKRRKRKKKKMLAKFNEANPWQSSSGSSSDEDNENDEDEDEDDEIESEGSLLFKSDHEFSPESDLEKDEESEPLRRARTARKAQSDVEEADDEYACQKCGKADHPEWILLCDSCDKGWHCSCLRPALMLIPEGDWFCPPCQHNLLVAKLRESLKTYDQLSKRHENEVLRKKRLAFVGISLDNVLHKNEAPRHQKESSQESDNESSSASSTTSSDGTTSSEESEPVYQLRERRCANTYKFNEYDDMINAAIQDEVEAVQGAGNQGRGKDIATIVNAEKEEAQLHFKDEVLNMDESLENKDNLDGKSEKDSDEEYKIEGEDAIDEDEEEHKGVVRKLLSRKKHRKLNSLDISSEDDPDSDEDFKGTSSEEEEDFDDHLTSSDESAFADVKRRGRKGDSRSVRRSTRATRFNEEFINDDSGEESDRPKRKKSRSTWDSDNEDSDNSWRQKKKKSKNLPTSRYRSLPKMKSRKKKKRKRIIESDNQSDNDDSAEEQRIEIPCETEEQSENKESMIPEVIDTKLENTNVNTEDKSNSELKDLKLEDINTEISDIPVSLPTEEVVVQPKKRKENTMKPKKAPIIRRKIIYGLPDEHKHQEEEEILSRRTRGRKINYQENIASDSEEELKKALRKTGESEDEFVVNEGEDLIEDPDKDSDSGDIYNPKKDGYKMKTKSPKNKKPRKSKSPGAKRRMINDGTPKQRKKPGPKPGSRNKARKQNFLIGSVIQKRDDHDSEKDVMSNVMDNPIGELDSKIDDNLSENVALSGTTMSVAGSFTGDVPEGSLTGLGPGELADLDDEQLEQMMMEDEEYGRRQLELAAIEIAKKKKKEEREAKKLEKARLKALEILAAERQQDPNAPQGLDGEVPKKKKRGRRSKAEILAEQMRRDGTPGLNSNTLPVSLSQNITSNMPQNVTPNMSSIMTPDAERTGEGHIPMMTGPDGQLFNPDGSPMKPKRRGRGKGKKTLALEAARAAEAAAKAAAEAGLIGMGTDSNPEMKSGEIPNVLPTPGSSTSGSAPSTPPAGVVTTQRPPSSQTPTSQSVYPSLPPNQQQSSVITRMLQSQPVSSSPQSFTAAAAAMGHKYFGGPNAGGQIMGGPRTGYEMQPRGRIPSPYRQAGQSSMPPHFAAVRSGTPPMRMRVPGPQMYHTPHHPMDPSPSGGGPISINNRDRSSPLGPGPAMIPPAAGSPLAKGGPTPPPPPPYVRGAPPLSRFADNPMGPRHQMPPFTNASPVNHNMQQPSPPPNRQPGNFSPYHPPPPPNYHYGAYPPPPPMSTADDAAAYQGSPYPADHFSSPADNQPPIQGPPAPQPPPQQQAHPNDAGAGNKQYDEEGSGEFGGLVSYFSSQREDDLDS